MTVAGWGTRWDGTSTTFAVRSAPARRVTVVVRPGGGGAGESWSEDLAPDGSGGWVLPGAPARPGDRYGFRVEGPGCNPNRLLLDPAGLAVEGRIDWAHARFDDPGADTGPHVPWSVVADGSFDWQGDAHVPVDPAARVVYEAAVGSLTARHPAVPPALRGTFLGMAHPEVVGHIASLGVTTVELLPVAQFVHARHLWARGLENRWGYDPVAWFAPHDGYATGGGGQQVAECKELVRTLHAAGLEVVLDVVFNHTGEHGPEGPTVSFRGFDPAWYRHAAAGGYEDFTGCHNTVDLRPAGHRALVLAALRYWVEEVHVDGFRFDLASALVRGDDGRPAPGEGILADIAADPVLAGRALVAEPWDAAHDGYRLGRFGPPWLEWNDQFRDAARRLWLDDGGRAELARRLCGSDDLFDRSDRRPSASVNFVTAHDGFTLADVVSYDRKHNEANGEGGNDGSSHEASSGHGAEGPTDDPGITAARARSRRNLLATVLVARGTPMLLAGDELGNSQSGNNNAYCQAGEVGDVGWDGPDDGFTAFVRHALAVRAAHPELHADRWIDDGEVAWLDDRGRELDPGAWADPGDRLVVRAHPGLVLVVNPDGERSVVLPGPGPWVAVLDTARTDGVPEPAPAAPAGATRPVGAASILVLVHPGHASGPGAGDQVAQAR